MEGDQMQRWLFAGVSDKRELILYICRLLAAAGHRVLLIDGTAGRKYQYLARNSTGDLPLIEFCGFDISAGLPEVVGEAETFKGQPEAEQHSGYDYVLYDFEPELPVRAWLWPQIDRFIWVTTFDHYEVERSAAWFRQLLQADPELGEISIEPVLVRTVESYLTADYMMSIVEDLPIHWEAEVTCIPWNEIDAAVHFENGHEHTLAIHKVTRSYKRALVSLLVQLAGWTRGEAKRALRSAQRRDL